MKCITLNKTTLRSGCLAISLCLLPGLSHAASCAYDIVDEWNNGFKAEITISNINQPSFSDWELAWSFADGVLGISPSKKT